MNCEKNDIAVVIRAPQTPELVGAVVKVVRLAVPGEFYLPHCRYVVVNGGKGPAWVISGEGRLLPCRTKDGGLHYETHRVLLDTCLRPLRDRPGEDETMSWKSLEEN